MGHCPGCGADIWGSGDTYGHILGCGVDPADQLQMRDRQVPWTREAQRRILAEALEQVFGEEKAGDRADDLAVALQERLSNVAGLTRDERERYGEPRIRPAGGQETIFRELNLIRRRLERLQKRL